MLLKNDNASSVATRHVGKTLFLRCGIEKRYSNHHHYGFDLTNSQSLPFWVYIMHSVCIQSYTDSKGMHYTYYDLLVIKVCFFLSKQKQYACIRIYE